MTVEQLIDLDGDGLIAAGDIVSVGAIVVLSGVAGGTLNAISGW